MTEVRHLTLIQQNDSHAHLELHWELFWRDGKPLFRRAGGYARAATVVRTIRQETNGRAILVDCGDTIHGTGPAQWTTGAIVVAPLNAMGVELMVPGNWDFGFGPGILRERVKEMTFPVIAANVENAGTGETEFNPSTTVEIDGVRIGFIGVTSPIVTDTMPASFGAGLRFTEPASAVRHTAARLRREEDVELVVLVSHLGFPQEVQLVSEVEGIDVVLSGHTHNRLVRPVRIGRTLMIQSGFDASFLGRLDLEIRQGKVANANYRLIEIGENVVPDPATEALVEELLRPYRKTLNEVVGQTSTGLHRMTVLESTMDNLITDAYLDLSGADVAFSHGWRYGTPVPPGDVTVQDLWQMIPTNPEVFTVEMSGQEILDKLENSLESVYAADPYRQRGGYVIRVSGLNAVVRLNNPPGTRVEHLDIAGHPFDADRIHTVATAGEQDVKDGSARNGTGVKAVDALSRYFQRHSPVSAELTHSKFVAV